MEALLSIGGRVSIILEAIRMCLLRCKREQLNAPIAHYIDLLLYPNIFLKNN